MELRVFLAVIQCQVWSQTAQASNPSSGEVRIGAKHEIAFDVEQRVFMPLFYLRSKTGPRIARVG